jgi:hypothetical protein
LTAPRPALILRYSPALFLFIVVVADAGRWADPDLWGHVYFGRHILALHHLPRHDIFSYSNYDHPWFDHEWLSEVVLASAYCLFGIVGLKLLKFFCTAVIVTLLTLGTAETGASIRLQLAVLVTTAVAIGPMVQFRPQLFDFIGLSALLLLLARDSYRNAGPSWFAIPLLALWANFHGGFFVGIVVLSVYTAVSAAENALTGMRKQRTLRMSGITLAAALATLVNPYGIRDWLTVIHTLQNPMTRARGERMAAAAF